MASILCVVWSVINKLHAKSLDIIRKIQYYTYGNWMYRYGGEKYIENMLSR